MFKCWWLGDTVIKFPQSKSLYPSSGSHLIVIFWTGLIEQCLPPERYWSWFRKFSNLWNLHLVNTSRPRSSLSRSGFQRFGIRNSCCTFLQRTPGAWIECHWQLGPIARIIACRGPNSTICRLWQGIIQRQRWCGGGVQGSCSCFR